MNTRVLAVDPANPDPGALDAAARVLEVGGLVAFATETVYGLGAVITKPAAVARIFAVKERPAINPLIVHVEGISQARACTAEWPDDAERLAARFWPGPLTLVLPRGPTVPDVVTAGANTVAVRAPSGAVARALVERLGEPIAAPSANRSNRISPTRAEHVLADFGGEIDLIIDSGPTTVGLESTVLDLAGEFPSILRPGPVSKADLEAALGGRVVLEEARGKRLSLPPRSPGQMGVHYAPRTPAYHVDSLSELLTLPPHEDRCLIILGAHADSGMPQASAGFVLDAPATAMRSLYDVLHRCDALAKRTIIIALPPDEPEWRAVRDRVMRATRPLSEAGRSLTQ
jgi:L-threonylcarbamoyladenylate synthase